MKKYWINEYPIKTNKELQLMYDLLMQLKKHGEDKCFIDLCRRTMDIARDWIGTKNVLCFAEYSSDSVVIVEFDCEPTGNEFTYAQVDKNGLYIEVDIDER